jgi:uncharacterized protein with PQ loop repeat
MTSDPTAIVRDEGPSERWLRRVLGSMSAFTMLMTIPQVWTIWVGHQAAGVSILSWSAYLLSAVLWFWYGLRKGDLNIYLPCVGWAGLDAAVIAGALVYG